VRYFLPVLVAGFFALGACGKRTSTGVSVSSVFRPLIPPDTEALAAFDVDEFKNSDFYKRHQSELNFPLLDAMSERIGLDPRRDISYLLLAWNGKQPIAMARGQFKLQTLGPKLVSAGMRRDQYKGVTFFGDARGAVAFEKQNVAIGGTLGVVRAEIDLVNGAGGSVPKELQPRLAAIPAGDQMWAVSRDGLAFAEAPTRSDINSALSNIAAYVSGASLGIAFDAGTHVSADIVCVSDQGAQRVRDALRGGIGLARLTTKDNESDLLRAYDAIQVSQDQQTIRVRADFSAELTDKLLAYLPALRSRAGQALRER
jgi:hypothetical protein